MIAYDDALRARLAANLAAHDVRTHDLEGRRRAAVSMIIVDSDAELHGHDDAGDIDVEGQMLDKEAEAIEDSLNGPAPSCASPL